MGRTVTVGRLQCTWEILDEEGEIPAEGAGVHPSGSQGSRTGGSWPARVEASGDGEGRLSRMSASSTIFQIEREGGGER